MSQRQITVKFDTSRQNVESLHKALSYVLKNYLSCEGCGRLAVWTIPIGDPEVPSELKGIGVTGIQEQN
jgi:hypothetical protein